MILIHGEIIFGISFNTFIVQTQGLIEITCLISKGLFGLNLLLDLALIPRCHIVKCE